MGTVAVAVLVLHGCTALKSGDDRASAVKALVEAGVSSKVASTCGHRGPPPRPDVQGSGGSLDLVFAVASSSFGFAATSVDDGGLLGYLDLGFDLDDTCTGEGQGTRCVEPPWATADHHDGLDGIDNAAGALFAAITPFASDSGPALESLANQIFRVRGYSGEADDDQVDVAVYDGFGLAPRGDGTTGLRWDGMDPWLILPDTLLPNEDAGSATYSLDAPRFHDEHAYVSGGVLVAQLPEALWPTGLTFAPSSLEPVSGVVLAGNLVKTGTQWELQHLVTGVRSSVTTFLAIAARFPNGNQPLCESATDYEALRGRICSFVDIASGPDSTSACDALSGGAVLDAKQAVLGGLAAPAAALPPCPEGVEREADVCGPSPASP